MEEPTARRRLVVAPQVTRSGLSEMELEEIAPKSQKVAPPFWRRLRNKLRCSGPVAKSLLLKFVPVLDWLPRYRVKDWLLGDFVSGLSVGIMQLPQGLAYALLASVPAVFGLYSSFYPVLLYSIFGTSRHISAGTFSIISVMIGSVTESMAPNEHFMLPSNKTVLDVMERDQARVEIATALNFLVGIFQILLGLMQFGFVVTYLSEPLVRGYTTAAAIHVTVSQLKNMFGLQFSQKNHPLSLIYTIITLCSKLPKTNPGTLVVSIIALVILFGVKYLSQKFSSKLRMPIPIELIMLVVVTGISYGAHLHAHFGIAIVGEIPVGLRAPSLPNSNLFGNLVGNAFAIAVVTYAFTISVCKMFAMKHAYKVDSNQELIALGICNLFGSFFQCFTIGTAMSRSLVQENTGGNSQLVGVVASLVILAIILKAGELFVHLPKVCIRKYPDEDAKLAIDALFLQTKGLIVSFNGKTAALAELVEDFPTRGKGVRWTRRTSVTMAVLSAIVIANLQGMFKQFTDIQVYWRTNQTDLLVWVVTFVATILLNMDLGLAVSVVFALLTVIFKTQLPHYSILGQVSETDIYRDVDEYPQAKEIEGVKIFRSSATLYYANVDLYAEALKSKCGIDVDVLIEKKKHALQKEKRNQEKVDKQFRKEQKKKRKEEERKEKDHVVEYMAVSSAVTMDVEEQNSQTPKLPEEVRLKSLALDSPPFHSLILDLTAVSSVDTVSIKVLKNLFKDFQELEVDVYLVGCQALVIKQLETGNFFGKAITKARLFSSIHDAVTSLSREQEQYMVPEAKDISNTKL